MDVDKIFRWAAGQFKRLAAADNVEDLGIHTMVNSIRPSISGNLLEDVVVKPLAEINKIVIMIPVDWLWFTQIDPQASITIWLPLKRTMSTERSFLEFR